MEPAKDHTGKGEHLVRTELKGKDFRGQFYVGRKHGIKAGSKTCIVSGFFFRVDTSKPAPY